jgi:hypothetical protein
MATKLVLACRLEFERPISIIYHIPQCHICLPKLEVYN